MQRLLQIRTLEKRMATNVRIRYRQNRLPNIAKKQQKHLWTHKIHRNVLCALQQQYDSRKADICQGQRQAHQQLKGAHNGDKLAKQRLQRAHQVRLAEDGADIGRSLHKHWHLNDYKEGFHNKRLKNHQNEADLDVKYREENRRHFDLHGTAYAYEY